MALKLNSSGGGSVTVDAPVTASNLTVTLPSSNGTIATTDGTNTTFTSITDSGNLTFTGTGNRITGDFSNATLTNRVLFQSSTTNGNTNLTLIPNGTGLIAQFWAAGGSDITNSPFASIAQVGTTDSRVQAGIQGSASYTPLTFYTGGSERMRIDTSGNVGIGTSSPAQILDVKTTSTTYQLRLGDTAASTWSYDLGRDTSDGYFKFTGNQTGGPYTGYKFYNGSTEAMRIDSTGNLLVGTTSASTPSTTGFISTANTFGFKNRIINGAFGIWQRGTTTSTTSTYLADRFWGSNSGAGTYTYSRDTGISSSFPYSAKISNTNMSSTSQYLRVNQNIESVNSYDLAVGSTFTVSFWVRSASNEGNVTVYYGYPSATDSFGTVVFPSNAAGSVNAVTSTWTRITQTFTVTAGAGSENPTYGLQLILSYSPATTGSREFQVTGVQLEKGTAATSFDYRPYGTELALCQRYYYKFVVDAAGQDMGCGFIISTTSAATYLQFPQTLRANPSALEQSGTASDYSVRNLATTTTCSAVPTFAAVTPYGGRVILTVASGLTAGQGCALRANAATSYLAWSAEL